MTAGGLRRQPALRRAARRARVRARRRRLGRTWSAPPARALRAHRRDRAGGRARARRAPVRDRRRRLAAATTRSAHRARRPTSTARCPARSPRPAARDAVKRCRPSTPAPFQVQAVAWHLQPAQRPDRHRVRVRPPGTVIAPLRRPHRCTTRASRRSRRDAAGGSSARRAPPERRALTCGRWPPTPHARRGRCGSGRSRRARVAVPARARAARAGVASRCAATSSSVGYWIDEGLSVGIADRPLTDIPGVLRQDGSPPLYYMLLHFWMSRDEQRRAVARTRCRCCSRCRRPGRVLGRGRSVRPPRRLVRGRAGGAQPVPHPVRAGDADVLAGRAAGLLATALFLRAYTRRRAPGARAGRCCSRSRSPPRSTRTTGRSSSAPRCSVAWLGLLVPGARRRAPRAAARRRARLRRRRRCSTCRGCRRCSTRPRTPARRGRGGPTTSRSRWRRRTGLLGHTAGSCWWSRRAAASSRSSRPAAAGTCTPEGRAVLAVGVVAVGTVLLAWTSSQVSPGVGDALPRDRRPAVPAARRGRARHAGRGLGVARPRDRRDPVGLRHVARRARATSAPSPHAIGPSLAPGDVVLSTQPEQVPVLHHYLPPGLRYATLTGSVDRRRRDRLARRRRAPAAPARRSATSSRSSTRCARAAARAGHADHLQHGALERAVDEARAAALAGVRAVR